VTGDTVASCSVKVELDLESTSVPTFGNKVLNRTYTVLSNASGYFRWHDSGDVQSFGHLMAIITIAERLPQINFWLPTKEKQFLTKLNKLNITVPSNLVIRLSMAMIDQAPLNSAWHLTSTVHDKGEPHGSECEAYKQGGQCLTCRKCWNGSIANISYPKH
jgi:hypothetical protein